MKGRAFLLAMLVNSLIGAVAVAQEAKEEGPPQILFKNVNGFDGDSPQLLTEVNVLIENNLIVEVSKTAQATTRS